MELNGRIKVAREAMGLSQSEFSELFSVTQRTVSNWESGRNEPPLNFFSIMFNVYAISLEWLIAGKGAMIDLFTKIEVPTKTKKLFVEAFKISYAASNLLDEDLNKYILNRIFQQIKEINRSEGFWDKLLLDRWYSIAYMRILTRSLCEAKNACNSNLLSMENTKDTLKNIIEMYQLQLIEDKANSLITDKTKRELLNWVDEDLDNLACFVILTDFDVAINLIEESLDYVDQLNFYKGMKE